MKIRKPKFYKAIRNFIGSLFGGSVLAVLYRYLIFTLTWGLVAIMFFLATATLVFEIIYRYTPHQIVP